MCPVADASLTNVREVMHAPLYCTGDITAAPYFFHPNLGAREVAVNRKIEKIIIYLVKHEILFTTVLHTEMATTNQFNG